MAGGYVQPAPDVVAQLTQQLSSLREQVRELQRADGSQIANVVANIIKPDYNYAVGSGYALPVGQANRVVQAWLEFVIPDGYTQALITATTNDSAVNSSASPGLFQSYIQIGTDATWAPSATAPAGFEAVATATTTSLVSGLTAGATVVVSSQPYATSSAWAASASNGTVINATCLYLR